MMSPLIKSIPVLILLQIGVLFAGAQDSSHWSFYIKAGYNTSDMAGSGAINDAYVAGENNSNSLYNSGAGGTKLRIGWHGGIGADFMLDKRVFIQGELNIEAKGGAVQLNEFFPSGSYSNEIDPVSGKAVYALNYLTVPVMIKYYFGKKRQIYGEAGLYYGYLLGGEEKGSFNNSGTKENYTSSIDDNYNHNDLGYTLGVGCDHQMHLLNLNGKLFLDLRFERSLFTLGSSANASGKPEVYNQSMSISIGYRVPL